MPYLKITPKLRPRKRTKGITRTEPDERLARHARVTFAANGTFVIKIAQDTVLSGLRQYFLQMFYDIQENYSLFTLNNEEQQIKISNKGLHSAKYYSVLLELK